MKLGGLENYQFSAIGPTGLDPDFVLDEAANKTCQEGKKVFSFQYYNVEKFPRHNFVWNSKSRRLFSCIRATPFCW